MLNMEYHLLFHSIIHFDCVMISISISSQRCEFSSFFGIEVEVQDIGSVRTFLGNTGLLLSDFLVWAGCTDTQTHTLHRVGHTRSPTEDVEFIADRLDR